MRPTPVRAATALSDEPVIPSVPRRRSAKPVDDASEVVYLTDADGWITWINEPVAALLGFPPEELIGLSFRSLLHPDDIEPTAEAYSLVAMEPGRSRRIRLRLRNSEGGFRWMDAVLTNQLDSAPLHAVVTDLRDITDQHEIKQHLERLVGVLEATPDIVVITGVDAHLEFANQAAKDFFGIPDDLFANDADVEPAPVDPAPADPAAGDSAAGDSESNAPRGTVMSGGDIQRVLLRTLGNRWEREVLPDLQHHGHWQGQAWYAKPDGTTIPMSVVVVAHRNASGHIDSFGAIARDQSGSRDLQAELAHLANHDALTALPNRTLLLDRLDELLTNPSDGDTSVGVLVCDLDEFKLVNDSLGPHEGDTVLAEVADRLLALARPDDLVVRYGGDEFVLVRQHTSSINELSELATTILTSVGQPYQLAGGDTVLSASIGVTRSTPLSRSASVLLRDAEAALHVAKERGRNRFELFDSRIRSRVLRRTAVERELRVALTTNQLRVHYQPAIDLTSGRPCGVEALVRWQHPERGMLLPGEFLPVAEETGLVVPLGSWVLRTALHDIRSLQGPADDGATLQLSVNLSTKQLENAFFDDEVAALLQKTAIAPGALTLELTEHTLMGDVEVQMQGLKKLGVHLSVDDFGTGFASLTYLKRFPVDEVKIDRSFVTGLGSDPADLAIAGAVVRLAGDLGMSSTAEGVETPDQLEALRGLGCNRAQGFLLARPMPLDDLRALLASDSPVPAA